MPPDSDIVLPPDCVSLAMLPYSRRRGFVYGFAGGFDLGFAS